jgi:hypothetical protein
MKNQMTIQNFTSDMAISQNRIQPELMNAGGYSTIANST